MQNVRAPGRNITVGEAVRRLNPHLFQTLDPEAKTLLDTAPMRLRIRQAKRFGPNKLEREAMEWLRHKYFDSCLRFHALALNLANGVRYTPDIVGCDPLSFWEVKGPKMWDDAVVKLKVAARQWPSAYIYLLYKEGPNWVEQRVLA